MLKNKLLHDILAYAIIAIAIILTAYKGTLDWMGLAIISVIIKVPGTQWIRDIFKKKGV